MFLRMRINYPMIINAWSLFGQDEPVIVLIAKYNLKLFFVWIIPDPFPISLAILEIVEKENVEVIMNCIKIIFSNLTFQKRYIWALYVIYVSLYG